MTHVVVVLPIGELQAAMAHADPQEGDGLIVTCSDPDWDRKYGPLRVFKAGQWIEATTYDERGHPLAHHQSEFAKQQLAAHHALAGVGA